MSRFRSVSPFLIAGAAGLAVLLLIPADPGQPQMTGLAIGDATPAPAGATTPPDAPLATLTVVATPVPTSPKPSPAPVSEPAAAVASLAPTDAAPATDPRYAWVGGSAVNVRAGPSTSTARLFVLNRGAKVTISESVGGWTFVEDPGGESGWVFSRYLLDSPAAAAAVAGKDQAGEAKKKYARVGSPVMLRAGPSPFAPKLFVLRPGERIAIAEVRGRWVRVVLESGASAWIQTGNLSR
jgi:uncharacterized protein YraI